MQNRRDQVQAHQFVVSRLLGGLFRGDPDSLEIPVRRTSRGIAIGAAAGAMACVGAVVVGLVAPTGPPAWRSGGSLVLDQQTGVRYLFDGKQLRPVRNYASARLIIGAQLTTTLATAASLAGVPHGTPVGIPGAPDDLPPTAGTHGAPWDVCGSETVDASGRGRANTTLAVDSDLAGHGLQGDQAVLVTGPDGAYDLIWRGSRLKLASGRAAAAALGYGTTMPLPVSASFLDALPQGPVLAPPKVSGAGQPGRTLNGHAARIGQVFQVQTPGSASQYYLLERAGLVPLTTTEANLALSAPTTRDAYGGATPTAIALPADILSSALAPSSPQSSGLGQGLPATPPPLASVDAGAAVCVRVTPSAGGATVGVLLAPAAPTATAGTVATSGTAGTAGTAARPSGTATTAGTAPTAGAQATTPGRGACLPVDGVAVQPQDGGLVRALGTAHGVASEAVYLVTDSGEKYLMTNQIAAGDLGYALGNARELPADLLAMLPSGPDLSTDDANAGLAHTSGGTAC